ncbi:hypothetical protein KJ865_12795, partial [Myxococcota bacterium]|nr:hypothetical protein [Myxococcota bacterium]
MKMPVITVLFGTLLLMGACKGSTGSGEACGDGVIDVGEDCDGTDLAGETCASLGYYGEGLSCD